MTALKDFFEDYMIYVCNASKENPMCERCSWFNKYTLWWTGIIENWID